MKFRDIAKMHAYNRGLKTPMVPADLQHYLDMLGDADSVTPGRLDKANDALSQLGEQLSKKWGFSKKFIHTDVPARAEAPGEDE